MTAAPSRAQVRLEFRDGLVTLTARDTSIRQILAEWARLGQTKIVNADRIVAPPVTLQLVRVPERQALDIVLRSVSGYVAAPRPTDVPGASQFDRILVMATSVPPANTPAPVSRPANPLSGRGPVQFNQSVLTQGAPAAEPPVANDDENADEEDEGEEPEAPNLQPGTRRSPRLVTPGLAPGLAPGFPTPFADPNRPPLTITPREPPPQTAPNPRNPWGTPAGTSPLPGVVAPPPNQPPQTPPRPPDSR